MGASLSLLSMKYPLVRALGEDIAIQWVLFVIAAWFKTEKFYDLAGSSTFIYLVIRTLRWGGTFYPRQKIQTGMVLIWAARLGLYLFTRILKEGKDRRFNRVRDNPQVFFIYWTVQALWVWTTLLPTMILNTKRTNKPFNGKDYLGWCLWVFGFALEAIADYQKSSFRSNPDNAGKWISSGLWQFSRHPNYLGEMVQWAGLYIAATSVMDSWTERLSVISPLFLTFLLTRVSGIPILERSGLKKWGQNPDYQSYLKNTAVLLPYIW